MKTNASHAFRVLGIYPSTKGFAFAVLETRGLLVTWGVARLYSIHEAEFYQRLEGLVEKYRVRLLCVHCNTGSQRSERTRRLMWLAVEYARTRRLQVVEAAQNRLRTVIGLHATARRYAVAERITELFPELEILLPPPRRPWQPEDERIGVFFAVSLAVAAAAKRADQVFKVAPT